MQGTASGGELSLDSEFAILRVEDAIVRLDGIEAVRLVPGEHRPVDELHLIVSPQSRPESVKRDVQAMLLDRFDLAVDWPAIQVARRPEEPPTLAADRSGRLVLDAVHLAMRRHGTSVTVELEDDSDRRTGQAGPAPTDGILEAVADAAAAAVASALGRRLDALDARVVPAGGDQIALVTVLLDDGRSQQRLSGCAVVRTNEADAVARAVLDATNRLERDETGRAA